MTGWLKISTAKEYVDVSDTRTLKKWFKHGLRFSQDESGSIRIKRQWLDDFLEAREVNRKKIDEIVSDVCEELAV